MSNKDKIEEVIFNNFITILKLNFNDAINIKRVDEDKYNKLNLKSCDFIIDINCPKPPPKLAVEIKSIGYNEYCTAEKKDITHKGKIVGSSGSFSINPSKLLIKSIKDASRQIENVQREENRVGPSILVIYSCPYLYKIVINHEDIDNWIQYEEMNRGTLKNNPHINGIALMDIYTGKILLSLYRNPYSTIPMGWEYDILFNGVK